MIRCDTCKRPVDDGGRVTRRYVLGSRRPGRVVAATCSACRPPCEGDEVMPLYEVMPKLVPAHHVIEAPDAEAAAEQAVADWADLMNDTGNVAVRELLSQTDYNQHIIAP